MYAFVNYCSAEYDRCVVLKFVTVCMCVQDVSVKTSSVKRSQYVVD